jgi:hypothetical protein
MTVHDHWPPDSGPPARQPTGTLSQMIPFGK